jgi:cell fate regulator YaaT (PSP1 superfamily)
MTLEVTLGDRETRFVSCPNDTEIRIGDNIIYKTERGEDIGKVIRMQKDKRKIGFRFIRRPTDSDMENVKLIKEKEKEAFRICKEEIKKKKLEMKLVGCHYQLDGTRIKFLFLAGTRVDIKALVRDLAERFNARIEMKQIGARDYARSFMGYGVCGRPLCCSTFMREFKPITTTLIKAQRLACGTEKLTGVCGKLMCCLRFEEDFYKEAQKRFPRIGTTIPTKNGKATVVDVDIFKGMVTVKYEEGRTSTIPIESIHKGFLPILRKKG